MSSDGYWSDTVEVQCPWCCERVEITVEPDTWGSLVQDCEVCCNPWQVHVTRDRHGDVDVRVERLEWVPPAHSQKKTRSEPGQGAPFHHRRLPASRSGG